MVAPVLSRAGSRIMAHQTSATLSMGTDNNGVNGQLEIARTPDFQAGRIISPAVTLVAGRNYMGNPTIDTGLLPGTRYYWRTVADDGAGGVTLGQPPLHAGSFVTTFADSSAQLRYLMGGCWPGWQMFDTTKKAQLYAMYFARMLNLQPHRFFAVGDVWYPDAGSQSWVDDGTSGYQDETWFVQARGVDDANRVRTETNLQNTLIGNFARSSGVTLAHLMAQIPTIAIPDDHDIAYNEYANAAGTIFQTGDATKKAVCHEIINDYFDIGFRDLINNDTDSSGVARSWQNDVIGEGVNTERYFVYDEGEVRFCFTNRHIERHENNVVDSPSKTTWGAEQNAWIRARILDNPKKFFVLVSQVSFDGDHGVWLEQDDHDGMKGRSYERDALFQFVWDNADPSRFCVMSNDTHSGYVIEYRGPNDAYYPIYEIGACNGWNVSSGHGYMTGVAKSANRATETIAASGEGGRLLQMRTDIFNCMYVDVNASRLSVNLYEPLTGNIAWTQQYK